MSRLVALLAAVLFVCVSCWEDGKLENYARGTGGSGGGGTGGASGAQQGGSGGDGGDSGTNQGGRDTGGQGGRTVGGEAGRDAGGQSGSDASGRAGADAGEGGTGIVTRPGPAPDVFMVEDFERGPNLSVRLGPCTEPQATVTESCDWEGISTAGCKSDHYCDKAEFCPLYIGREEDAWRGDHSLRLHYNIDAMNSFAGIMLRFGTPDTDDGACVVGRAPVDLSKFGYLVFSLRAGDELGNVEVALKAIGAAPGEEIETNPKKTLWGLDPRVTPPEHEWIQVMFPLCDLVKKVEVGMDPVSLDVTAVTKVLIGFARGRFAEEGTYKPGSRYVDVDDVYFEPCRPGPCDACP